MSNSDRVVLAICALLKKYQRSNSFGQVALRNKILRLYALYNVVVSREKATQRRQFWVRPIFTAERRFLQGASDNLVREMETEDAEKFVNYFRMDRGIFEHLLQLIGPSITKQSVVRDAIPPVTRLHITLRYLASGDSMTSVSYAYRVAHNTVSKIVAETCDAVWNVLKEPVFLDDNPESWEKIADDFDSLWNYPNCGGCIDGKHVVLQVRIYQKRMCYYELSGD